MATPYPRAVRRFPKLRQSTLQRFADCQLSAGAELRLSIRQPTRARALELHTSGYTSHRAGAGRVVHATVARSLRHMLARTEERIAPETVIDFYDDELRMAGLDVGDTFAIPAHEDRQMRKTLRKWAKDGAITIEDVYGIEERLEAVIHYPDGKGGSVARTVTGQLDLLLLTEDQKHATVPDWKDTWKLPAQKHDDEADEDDGEDDEISVEGYFQQRMYALLVFLTLPTVQSVTLREFYLRRSKPREATIWRHELPDLLRYFAALVERFDRCVQAAYEPAPGRKVRRVPLVTPAQWGEPSPGAHCSYCPHGLDCPLGVEAREAGMIRTPEEAESVAGMLLVARRAVSMLDKSLRTWGDLYGPVRVRDAKRTRFFGFVDAVRTERPSLRQVNDALMGGRDVRDLFRTKTHTRWTDYSPDQDVSAELDDDDVVEMFERAAEQARKKNAKRRRSAA